jgi:hypothetical protein
MPITEEIKKTIKDALNEALSDFNNAYLGIIEEDALHGNYGKLQTYTVIECAEDYDIEEYIAHWEWRIYNALHAEMQKPVYPVVETDYDGSAYTIMIGYAFKTPPFIRSLDDCPEDAHIGHTKYY